MNKEINVKIPVNHTTVSYVKSGVRIFGFLAIGFGAIATGAFVLIAAEVLGIYEEMVI